MLINFKTSPLYWIHYFFLSLSLSRCAGSSRVSACGPPGGAAAFLRAAAAASSVEETLLPGACTWEAAGIRSTCSAAGPTGSAVQPSTGQLWWAPVSDTQTLLQIVLYLTDSCFVNAAPWNSYFLKKKKDGRFSSGCCFGVFWFWFEASLGLCPAQHCRRIFICVMENEWKFWLKSYENPVITLVLDYKSPFVYFFGFPFLSL